MREALTGTGQLIRLILRRDRIRLPLWMLGFLALTSFTAAAVTDLYKTPEQVAGYEATVTSSAAGKFMNGRPYDVDSLGAIASYELTSTVQVMMALLVLFLVVRHTRAEEETGRAELLRSTRLGRHAHTASTLIVASTASLLLGLIDALILTATGLDAGGAMLHGAALAGIGLVFTAITATAAQVMTSARGSLGLAGAAIGLLFVLRGAGDVNGTIWTWLSPFGWGQAARPFGETQWWPVPALLAFAAAVALLAGYLTAHRDEGAGLIQPRPGSPRARAGLGTSFGLALRLQRGLIIGWATGLVLMAGLFGSFGSEIEDLLASNEDMAELFAVQGVDVVDGYFAYVLAFMAVLASAFTLASALRMRSEENTGRADAVLATRVSRLRWAAGWLAVTVLSTLATLTLVGVATGGTHWIITGDGEYVARSVWAMVAAGPAVYLVAAVGVLAYGWLPRWALVAWAVFALAMVQAYLGELLDLPGAVSALSPFQHLPEIPVEDFDATPVVVITALAVGCAVAGLWRFRTRDLTTA